MPLNKETLVAGFGHIAAHMETASDLLNELDGRLGDGDLGVTMLRGSREVAKVLPELPDDLGRALMTCAQAFTRASGSSFGTLLAASLLSAAKTLKGKTEADWSDLPALLQGALERMMALGNAHLGDKTVLDVLDASIKAMAGKSDPADLLAAGIAATTATIAAMKALPNKIGRAGNMSERSVGHEDPGQVAFLEILNGLKSASTSFS